VLDKHKMAKYFALDITDTRFAFAHKTEQITAEAALDGSMSCAPACPPQRSTTPPRCAATNP
jgi:hypothetical protein